MFWQVYFQGPIKVGSAYPGFIYNRRQLQQALEIPETGVLGAVTFIVIEVLPTVAPGISRPLRAISVASLGIVMRLTPFLPAWTIGTAALSRLIFAPSITARSMGALRFPAARRPLVAAAAPGARILLLPPTARSLVPAAPTRTFAPISVAGPGGFSGGALPIF